MLNSANESDGSWYRIKQNINIFIIKPNGKSI